MGSGALLALRHEAVFGGAVKRLALGTDGFAFAGLRHGKADGENRYQGRNGDASHLSPPRLPRQWRASGQGTGGRPRVAGADLTKHDAAEASPWGPASPSIEGLAGRDRGRLGPVAIGVRRGS